MARTARQIARIRRDFDLLARRIAAYALAPEGPVKRSKRPAPWVSLRSVKVRFATFVEGSDLSPVAFLLGSIAERLEELARAGVIHATRKNRTASPLRFFVELKGYRFNRLTFQPGKPIKPTARNRYTLNSPVLADISAIGAAWESFVRVLETTYANMDYDIVFIRSVRVSIGVLPNAPPKKPRPKSRGRGSSRHRKRPMVKRSRGMRGKQRRGRNRKR